MEHVCQCALDTLYLVTSENFLSPVLFLHLQKVGVACFPFSQVCCVEYINVRLLTVPEMLEDSVYTAFTDFQIGLHRKPNIATTLESQRQSLLEEKQQRFCLILKAYIRNMIMCKQDLIPGILFRRKCTEV